MDGNNSAAGVGALSCPPQPRRVEVVQPVAEPPV